MSEAFGQLRAAFQEASNTADHVLSVTALNTFATNWLVPRLGAFQLAHPGIAVKLDVSSELFDFSREDVDVGIRSGSGEWPGLVSHGLFAAAYTPMLSPRMLEQYGPLDEPADLLNLPLIDPTDDWWPKWFASAGVTAPDLSGRTGISVLNQQIAGRVALAGHGAAILMPAFFPDELAEWPAHPAVPVRAPIGGNPLLARLFRGAAPGAENPRFSRLDPGDGRERGCGARNPAARRRNPRRHQARARFAPCGRSCPRSGLMRGRPR